MMEGLPGKLEQFWGRLAADWQVSVEKSLMGRTHCPTGCAPSTGRTRVNFAIGESA